MKKILIIGKHTLEELMSSKIFSYSFYFSIIAFIFITFLSSLSVQEKKTILESNGLFFIEFLNVLIIIYLSSTYLSTQIKEKSIYLILTKGVKRSEYVIGINLGIVYLMMVNILLMGGVFSLILIVEKSFSLWYLQALGFVLLKLIIIGSIGILFTTISESELFCIILNFTFYFLGHFLGELKLMLAYTTNAGLKVILNLASIILPKYYLLNYRDYLLKSLNSFETLNILFYSIIYIIIITSISCFAFNKRQL